MSFFSAFSYTSPVMPIIDKKKVNSVTTTVYYGPKRQKDIFFHYFWWRNHYSLAHTFSKMIHSLKKHIALTPIFYQKNLHSLKTRYSLVIFFQNFRELPPPIMQTIGKKNENSVKTILYFKLKKSIGCLIF